MSRATYACFNLLWTAVGYIHLEHPLNLKQLTVGDPMPWRERSTWWCSPTESWNYTKNGKTEVSLCCLASWHLTWLDRLRTMSGGSESFKVLLGESGIPIPRLYLVRASSTSSVARSLISPAKDCSTSLQISIFVEFFLSHFRETQLWNQTILVPLWTTARQPITIHYQARKAKRSIEIIAQ